jgi:hypothetical protein
VKDLLTGNAWLTSQREAWELVASEREQAIMALTSNLQVSNQRLSESDAMLSRVRNHWVMRLINRLFNRQFF